MSSQQVLNEVRTIAEKIASRLSGPEGLFTVFFERTDWGDHNVYIERKPCLEEIDWIILTVTPTNTTSFEFHTCEGPGLWVGSHVHDIPELCESVIDVVADAFRRWPQDYDCNRPWLEPEDD